MRFQTLAEWLAWQEALHPQTIDLGLGRVAQVHRDMGMPGREAFTITVGGTNGKGSCVAMLDSILRSAGYKVATYTSPHILRYNERICVAGRPVDDSRICAAFERIDQARGDVSLSFFEFGTLAALDIFSGEDLEVQLLEVGLGGRLDAVNLIDADISLIASIDIDHQDWLGDTREAIGYEKAGIFRKDRPAVLGDPSAPFSVIRHAEEQGVPLYRLGEHFRYETTPAGWTWSSAGTRLENLPVPAIPGEHQLMNASAVLQALDLAAAQRPVSREAIEAGLRGVNLPGRFQLFPGEVSVLLDVAHNNQAVRILARHLRAHYPGKRIHAVFSVMRDKDIAGIVATIRELIDDWHLAPLKMARAAVPEELAAMLHGLGVGSVHADYDDAGEAFASARRTAQNGDLILVFGSFFLVSEYLVHAA